MRQDEADKIVSAALRLLKPHFEAAQIMVTWMEEDEAKAIWSGCGNKYARKQLANEFVVDDDQEHLAELISNAICDDDLEDWQRDE